MVQLRMIFDVFAETYSEFATHSSIHGLKYTIDKKLSRIERISWVLVVLMGFIASGLMFQLFWDRFLSHPTRTNYDSIHVQLNDTEFPSLAICTDLAIMKPRLDQKMSKMNLLGYDRKEMSYFMSQLFHRNSNLINNTALNILDHVLYKNNITNIVEFVSSISPHCEDIIVKCVWKSVEYSCYDSVVDFFVEHRKCCYLMKLKTTSPLINPTNTIYNEFSDYEMGLKVILSLPENNTIDKKEPSLFVTINGKSDRYSGRSKNIHLTPNTLTVVSVLTRNLDSDDYLKSISPEKRECVFEDEIQMDIFDIYSQSNCKASSKFNEVFEKCGCYSFFHPKKFPDEQFCKNVTKLPCILKVNYSPVTTFCPQTCNTIIYDTAVSSVPVINNEDFCINPFYKDFNMTASTRILQVHHEYIFTKRYRRKIIASSIYLLYSLGGVFSLFLGCNFISLAEMFYYMFIKLPINLRQIYKRKHTLNKSKENSIFYFTDFKVKERNSSIIMNYNKYEYYGNNHQTEQKKLKKIFF